MPIGRLPAGKEQVKKDHQGHPAKDHQEHDWNRLERTWAYLSGSRTPGFVQ